MTALSQEGDRFKRVELLVDIGTAALRIKFDELLPPTTLKETLRHVQGYIKFRSSKQEYATLYPAYGTVSSMNMDMTLMVLVLRNSGKLQPPNSSTFDNKPHDHEVSDGADVARLKFYRNALVHAIVKELNVHEFHEISQTLIKVIRRFSGSRFDDQINCIMTRSLDYRATSITWHAQEAVALVPNALNESVLQPAKASVIRLNKQQPLPYSIIGGTVLSYGMQNISVIPSRKVIIYYLRVLQNFTVKQFVLILNEHPFLNQKLAELILCQGKQNHPPNNIKHVDVRTEPIATIPEDVSASKSSNVPRRYSQCGQVKQLCKDHTRRCYRQLDSKHNTIRCYRQLDSKNNTTKNKYSNFYGSNIKNTCQMNQQSVFPSSCQSSPCVGHLGTDFQRYNSTPSLTRYNPCYTGRINTCRPNACSPNARQSDLNGNDHCVIQRGENIEHVEENRANIEHDKERRENIEHVEHVEHVAVYAPMICVASIAQMLVILWLALFISINAFYPKLRDYFKSRFIAAILTVPIVILQMLLVYFLLTCRDVFREYISF